MDNPRRHCLKKANPHLFHTVANLQHPALPSGQSWSGYGNRFLLDRPEKRAIRVSRKASPAEIATLRDEVLAEAAQGVVIVSPFISLGEKEIAKAILTASAGDVILMKHDGFPPLFKPQGRYFDLCVQGRLLIISSGSFRVHAENSVATLPAALTRETCLMMNAACAHIEKTSYEC